MTETAERYDVSAIARNIDAAFKSAQEKERGRRYAEALIEAIGPDAWTSIDWRKDMDWFTRPLISQIIEAVEQGDECALGRALMGPAREYVVSCVKHSASRYPRKAVEHWETESGEVF